MRTRDLRITSFIVVFPVALILLSLCTVLCLAIAAQVKSLYPAFFLSSSSSSARHRISQSDTHVPASGSGLSSPQAVYRYLFCALTLRSFMYMVALCIALGVIVQGCRLFHKLRTQHALDSCLERIAEYRIPGTTCSSSNKKIAHVSRWSPFKTSFFPALSTEEEPALGAAWLLSRNGNGSLSLHPSQDVDGSSILASSLSPNTTSAKPYCRFDPSSASSSSPSASSSHVYITRQPESREHLPALQGAPSPPLQQQQQPQQQQPSPPRTARSIPTLDTSSAADDSDPARTTTHSAALHVHSDKLQHIAPPTTTTAAETSNGMLTRPPQHREKKRPKKKQQQQQQQQQTSSAGTSRSAAQKDVVVIPAPATTGSKRTVSNSKKRREQKKLRQRASRESTTSQGCANATAAAGDTGNNEDASTLQPQPPQPESNVVRKQSTPDNMKWQREHRAPASTGTQHWYSPFSTGLEIDIMPRTALPAPPQPPTTRRYTLFGEPVRAVHPRAPVPQEYADDHGGGLYAIARPVSGWNHHHYQPPPRSPGQLSATLSASPPSPPRMFSYRQFSRAPPFLSSHPPLYDEGGIHRSRPFPSSPSSVGGGDWASECSSSDSLSLRDRLPPFGGSRDSSGSHFSLFSNEDEYAPFH